MAWNPRPCQCGCLPHDHALAGSGHCRNCWAGTIPLCRSFRKRLRKVPLRAKRNNTSGHFWHQRLDEMAPPTVTREEVEQIVMDTLARLHLEAQLR